MNSEIIGKFLFFWVFVLGGMVMGKVFGLTKSTPSVIGLFICLAIMYVGFQLIRSNAKKKSAAKRAAPTPKSNNRHGKKKH
ncbi:MAG: hypothetical protein RSA73_06910 [Anaerovoracaceae bacterium]